MHWFRVSNAIFFLFILTQKFTFASVKNVTHQGMNPAKVFTNLLKVPWINLDSSWADAVTSTCRNDITTLFESTIAGEMWALQMLDAGSKIPSGILTGNIRDLGMYEECVRVKSPENRGNIQGRHCMFSLSMPSKVVRDPAPILFIQKLSAYNPTANVDLNFAPSLCLPSSCDVEDIAGLVDASIQGTPEFAQFGVKVAEVTCSSVQAGSDPLTLGTMLAISFFAVVAIILIFCTACEVVVKIRSNNTPMSLKILAEFSLYKNTIKLFSTEIVPGTMPFVHGIRFISMCCIVIVHRFLSTMVRPVVNLTAIWELRGAWLAPGILMTPYAVDTFFVLSGFLTAYSILTKLNSGGKIPILELYLHRYVRLTPCIVALILFNMFILPLIGSGPVWQIVSGLSTDFCRKNWWTNLLYIQNFVNGKEMCMVHLWYTAVEMQLFWLCPIILFPLFHRPKIGLVILSTLSIVSFITPAIDCVLNQYAYLFNNQKTFYEQYTEFIEFYTPTYNRALPYFVGIFLGYYVANSKRALTRRQAAVNWILTCILLLFCSWSTFHVQPHAAEFNVTWEAIYVSVSRLSWSLAIVWIIYACTRGYGGPVARFLSLPFFVPLSRLSYTIYLASAMIQVGSTATEHTAQFESIRGTIYYICGDLIMSIGAAFFLSLCFETPVIVLEKILRAKHPSEIFKSPSIEKRKKLLSIIRQYPDSANGRVNDLNSTVQSKMLQPDFWRAVTDLLDTTGRTPTKTPVEWMETWQNWKADLSKHGSQRRIRANRIQNELSQSETETISLEKELLIFLASVCCDSDNTGKLEELQIEEPERSRLSNSASRNKDKVR